MKVGEVLRQRRVANDPVVVLRSVAYRCRVFLCLCSAQAMEEDLGDALVKEKDAIDEQHEQQKLEAMGPGIVDHGVFVALHSPARADHAMQSGTGLTVCVIWWWAHLCATSLATSASTCFGS
jgi:hypothetical protein